MDEKFFGNNLWYHYLTGEFKVAPPPGFIPFRNILGKCMIFCPATLIALIAAFPWQG